MNVTHPTADEQTKLWNGPAGRAWVDAQETLDRMFKPLEDLLVEAVAAAHARSVLDVGCGTGSTTLAAARAIGADGRCTGVDISEPMIASARARFAATNGKHGAEPQSAASAHTAPAHAVAQTPHATTHFLVANAQTHSFEPATFDSIISRFGVMFFEDFPTAFSNLHRAAKPSAHLRFIAWRSPAENPFMTTAERAAAPLLPNLPPRKPDAPGQFAFADPNRVRRILEESGWSSIDLRAVDVTCTFPESELTLYVSRLGPVGMTLQEADEQTRSRVIETVRAAFNSYVHGSEVRFTAACWLADARA